MAEDRDLMPSCLDREVLTPERDAFGHRHFAHALRSLIESEEHEPPFSIGLLGGWGTGKSTIKELYIADLRDDARKGSGGRTRGDRIRSITFNAWRFGGHDQDIKRALLRHVFLELGGDEENLQDRLFRQVTESREDRKGWWEYTWEVLKAWAMPLPAFVLALLLLVVLILGALWLLPLESELARTLITLGLIGAFTYLVKQVKSPPVATGRPLTRIDLPITNAEQYEQLLLDQIRKFKAGDSTPPDRKNGRACERLVVFVDDLDRLSSEEMVLGLDAVRTFMEIPEAQLPDGLGVVFVISCDETRVADALSKGRRHGDLPGTVFTHSDARRYLDRIFQFRLEIPPFPRQDMRQYAIQKFGELKNIAGDLEARGVQVEAVVDRMIHVGVQDPRNALQIVNAFAQAWWLAKKRETEELGSERPGGLHEGAVTRHPIALGALCAIKVDFPDFYREVQRDPSLIHRLTDLFVRGKRLEDQPLATQQLVREKYLERLEEGSGAEPDLRPEYRPLRQFLASLVGLRWPDSLQSLLLLSEDAVSRKFGEKATAVFDALVSGDTAGVRENLGRHADSAPLKREESRLLYQMVEDLRHESVTRRVSASRVVADLVERLHEGTAGLLTGALCRELGDSPDLRSQLGVSRIERILGAAHGDDRRAVASRLVEDVLTVSEDMRLRLETMESPNLEEAVGFARSVVSLTLGVRRDHGLDPVADAQLLDWLVERTVRIEGKEQQLPFNELEEWIGEHEDHLLLSLQDRYTDLLAGELESQGTLGFDGAEAVRRARRVFEELWAAGEETRQRLWSQVERYVAVQLPEAVEAAWQTMVRHVTSAASSDVSGFVTALVGRLRKEAEEEGWELDREAAGEALLSVVGARRSELDQEALGGLADLAVVWSERDETAVLSCNVVGELKEASVEELKRVFDNWAGRILGDLPLECVRLFAGEFAELEPSTQASAAAQLKPVVATDAIEEPKGERYRAFVTGVPEAVWDEDPLKSHLENLLPQLPGRHNNPNDYLYRVFPAVVQVLDHASPGILGQALQNLFTQAKGQVKHYAWLHSLMVKRWPQQSRDLTAYDPEQIFRDGHAFALKHPKEASEGLLRSLRDMIEREIVSGDQRGAVVEAACAIWNAVPDQAVETFASGFGALTPDQAANLVDGVDWTNGDHEDLLSRAWSSVLEWQDLAERVQTTKRLLDKGLNGPEEEPDRAIRLWLQAQGTRRLEVLTAALTDDGLGDPHRKRLWQQAVGGRDAVGAEFVLEVIPKLVMLSPNDQTTAQVFGDYERVEAILDSADNRADLAQRLMETFTDASTNTVKSHIAEWCKKLSGEASLAKVNAEAVTEEDLSILKTHFRSKALSRIKKARQSD